MAQDADACGSIPAIENRFIRKPDTGFEIRTDSLKKLGQLGALRRAPAATLSRFVPTRALAFRLPMPFLSESWSTCPSRVTWLSTSSARTPARRNACVRTAR